MKKLLLVTAITAAIFAVDASAVTKVVPVANSANAIPTIAGSVTPANLQVDFSATTGVQFLLNVPAANIIYSTGSSAATKFLGNAVTAMAKPNTVVYLYKNVKADILTYIFTAGPAGASAGLTADKTYIVHKRDRDGSVTAAIAASTTPDKATGVTFNTLADLAAKAYTCTLPTLSSTAAVVSTCTGTADTAPALAPKTAYILGIADVDAGQFGSALNGATATNKLAAAVVKMGSTPIAAQVFGVAVTTKLRNAMQTAELASGALPSTCTVGDETEACMANLTTEQITSLFAQGRMNDWASLSYAQGANLVSANSANLPGNTAVHICSRAAGSGTLATLNTVFENAPCNASNEAIQAAADGVDTWGIEGANASAKAYHSTMGSGDLEQCLETMDAYDPAVTTAPHAGTAMVANGTGFSSNVANTAGGLPVLSGTNNFRWAVGILNADRNASNSLPYRFVKIDGSSPSLANAANGKYRFWSELSYLTADKTTKTQPAGATAALVKAMTDPLIIVKSKATNTAGWVSGYMGTAATALSTATAFDITRPVMPFTHAALGNAAGSVNHCRAPAILGGAYPLPGLN